jgi:alpha-L-fucosidase
MQLLRTGDPNGKYWMPAMSDAPLRGYNGRHEWFWEPGDEAHVYPLEKLVEMYYKSVGRNSTLILGLTPDPNGLMPEPDVKRLKEWGDEIRRRFARPIAQASGEGNTLVLDLESSQRINHAILMEDIAQGERVREYVLEGLVDGNWIRLSAGSCIGHKHINEFDDATVTKVRLRITEAVARPLIRNLSVFYVN